MNKHFEEFRVTIEEEMPNMSKKAIYAFVGTINAFMTMGFVNREERLALLEMLYEKEYVTKQDVREIVGFGL